MSWGLENYTYDIGMGDLSLGAGFMYSLGDCTLWLFKVSPWKITTILMVNQWKSS